jgi:gluconate kinase
LLDSQLRDLEPPAAGEPAHAIWIDAAQPVVAAVHAIRKRLGL